ncbi:HAD family hydrolase [Rhizomonospora bruguierae]|uniref:HAD family hydrolase n=1 Tax=Rhizomonospora bruguierae TaxID=1581705 RepID=UPI0024BD9547|nr:HAD family hydrolase [Micromonospora sp. NBRC 107566]
MRPPLTVGFDLDMTLLDTRPGIAAAYRALSAQTGVPVDADAAVARLGPPLREEIRRWFPPERVDSAVAAYRALYPRYAVQPSPPLPGAREAIAAVRAQGGRVVVITSKLGRLAQLHLDHCGIVADALVGDRFAAGKSNALAEQDVHVYVGDHVADMRAARAAGVTAIGVPTGPCSADELRAAGADAVLPDLTEFPGWLSARSFDPPPGRDTGWACPA